MLNNKKIRFLVLTWLFASFSLIFSANAMQVERMFPEGIKRGKLSTTALAELVIDGKLRQSAIGIRIYSEDNLTVTPASVDVNNVVIYYLENEFGEIQKIWILTAEEASKPIPKRP
ncbi:hypothetical protein [Undibacterium danionis]|uniref:DUF4258 domain-containing protein n=1 Tax=Undibacterium danionis TaxID=1812100 RepID=A0ABV6II57_9BURK